MLGRFSAATTCGALVNSFSRAHGWWTALATTLISSFVFALLSSYAIPLPSIVAGGLTPVKSAAVLSLAPAIAATWSLDRTPRALQQTASRPLRRIQLLVIAAAIAIPAALVVTWTLLVPLPEGGMFLRDVIGYLGLALLGRLIMREGALLPALFLLIATLFGPQLGGRVSAWAWCISPGDDPVALLIALSLLAAGLAVHMAGKEPRLISGLRSA